MQTHRTHDQRRSKRTGRTEPHAAVEQPWPPDDSPERTAAPDPELDDPSELEIDDPPASDDAYWDAFIPDDDEYDPLPEPGDFWVDESQESRVDGQEPAGQVVTCH